MLLQLFNKRVNEEWKRDSITSTPLGLYLDVNFEIIDIVYTIDEPYLSMHANKKITDQELGMMIKERNNVVSEYRIVIQAMK